MYQPIQARIDALVQDAKRTNPPLVPTLRTIRGWDEATISQVLDLVRTTDDATLGAAAVLLRGAGGRPATVAGLPREQWDTFLTRAVADNQLRREIIETVFEEFEGR
jgi:hypothetical protein